MKTFRTTIELKKSEELITYKDKIMFFGSCFTDNIGNKFLNLCFNTIVNPFGVLYNPLSVSKNIKNLIEKKKYTESDIFYHNDQWRSFDHHGSFSHIEKNQYLENINKNQEESSKFIDNASFLFITFGTAFVYNHKATNQIVANCHKIPDNEFNRELINVDSIINEYDDLIKRLIFENPKLKIVFTISPVRHWKDGAEQNNLSKSILKVSIDKICKQNPEASYYPSYEIMMDDLRDYRFYKDDMLHPNNIAIEYIWNHFSDLFWLKYFTDY